MRKAIYSAENAALTAWLREKRIGANLTMRALAARLDIYPSVWWGIESGARRLDVVEYLQACRALGADPLDGVKKAAAVNPAPKPGGGRDIK